MRIQTGYLYHIKDSFFNDLKNYGLMLNHGGKHSRPSYLVIKSKDILWFIPLSTQINKYEKIREEKLKKYGKCYTILIKYIGGIKQAILLQNAFPTLEKYIKSIHVRDNNYIKASTYVQRDIIKNFKAMLSLKDQGINLFFTDIEKILEILSKELINN